MESSTYARQHFAKSWTIQRHHGLYSLLLALPYSCHVMRIFLRNFTAWLGCKRLLDRVKATRRRRCHTRPTLPIMLG